MKVRLLLRGYIEWSTTGLLGLKKPLKELAHQYPNLITEFLNKCSRSVECKYKRLTIRKPLVSYGDTLEAPWTGNERLGTVLKPVDALVIGFSGFMDNDGPFEAIVEFGELPAFGTDSLKRVIQFKWQQFGFPIYKLLSWLHLLVTIGFSIGQVSIAVFPSWKGMQASQEDGAGVLWIVVHAVVAVGVLPFLFFEAKEIFREGLCNYMKDPSNYLEVCNCLGVLMPIPYFFIVNEKLPAVVTSILILLTWLRVLMYLRAYELTGSLMRMIVSIISGMRVFMLIMSILAVGYIASFTVLFPSRIKFSGQRLRIVITFFEAMLGEPTMMALFGDPANPVAELNLTSAEFLKNEESWMEEESLVRIMFGQLLLIVFYLLVVVVMLNLLIAIMGNAYDEIAQNEDVEMQRARAQAILYIERNILFDFMYNWDTFFPRYLHVLQPHHGQDDSFELEAAHATAEGRLAIHFNDEMKKMEKKITVMSEKIELKMADMMTLLGAGLLIKRNDHPHQLRHVSYKNWARTIPAWRCTTCATDYQAKDKRLAAIEPPVFVCNHHYDELMMRDNLDEEWQPPAGCDFALCAKCVRNQEPLPTEESKARKEAQKKFEQAEAEAKKETEKEEEELDLTLPMPEMSLDMLEAGDDDMPEMSAEDMFALLND